MEGGEEHTEFFIDGEREIKSLLEDRDVDGRIRAEYSLTSGVGVMDYILLAQDRDKWQGLCACVNELLGSIRCAVFLDHLRSSYFIKNSYPPWI